VDGGDQRVVTVLPLVSDVRTRGDGSSNSFGIAMAEGRDQFEILFRHRNDRDSLTSTVCGGHGRFPGN
jgi:hypothetical protein